MIDVTYLAKLSQMTVSAKETVSLQKGFKQTLKTIALLDELDTSKVDSTFQITGMHNVFREDKINKPKILSQKQALSNAKKTHQGYFVVPYVFS